MSEIALDIVILAAGAGKRMKIAHPKALHPVFFRPMIHYVLDAAMAIPHRSVSLIVGRAERELREQCRNYSDLQIVRQESPLGAVDALRAVAPIFGAQDSNVLILNGDTVLITPRSLQELVAKHEQSGSGCTAGLAAPEGAAELYCFRAGVLAEALKRMSPGQLYQESFLADAAPNPMTQYIFSDAAEVLDINNQFDLWRVEVILQDRTNRDLMRNGVALQDPRTTLIDPRCRIGNDVRIEAGCTVINSVLESGVLVENFCRVIDSEIGAGSQVKQGTCIEKSRVGRDCRVGPYARLRSGANLEEGVWIGNFVEIKNASLGAGTRAAHLSFIGDAQVGRNVNIGCGFITCNSSGRPLKQRTIIEDNVFIGSASQAIAPVTLGAGSFIATGTSVTEDVPPDSFVISRGRQVVKPGYAKKYGKSKGALSSH